MRLFDVLFARSLSGGNSQPSSVVNAYYSELNLQNANLSALKIGEGVQEIPDRFAYNCENLEVLNLPSSLEVIGVLAFYGCKSLQAVDLPIHLVAIKEGCFAYCSSLKALKIPSSVLTIESYAFNGCDSLAVIDMTEFDGSRCPTLGNGVFFTYQHPEGFRFVFKNETALLAFSSAAGWSGYQEYFEVAT